MFCSLFKKIYCIIMGHIKVVNREDAEQRKVMDKLARKIYQEEMGLIVEPVEKLESILLDLLKPE